MQFGKPAFFQACQTVLGFIDLKHFLLQTRPLKPANLVRRNFANRKRPLTSDHIGEGGNRKLNPRLGWAFNVNAHSIIDCKVVFFGSSHQRAWV